MKTLLAFIFAARPERPVFAEDVNAERAMRTAELKWLLAEIAAAFPDREIEACLHSH